MYEQFEISLLYFFHFFFLNAWQGVLYHVRGEHTWAEASCRHGPHVEEECTRKALEKSSKAMAALRKIVLDHSSLTYISMFASGEHCC